MRTNSLSRVSRYLTYITAVFFAVTGVTLFFFPARVASAFTWTVSPFMAMTIGGWCLGNAWLAYISACRWQWSEVYTALIYLWLFSFLQSAIMVGFRDRLNLTSPFAWLYLAALAVNGITGVVGMLDLFRLRPRREFSGAQMGWLSRASVLAFVLFVGFISVYGLTVQVGARGTNGGIFPEVMTLITLRAFAGFYLSLALAATLLLFERNQPTLFHHYTASYGLFLAVTAAAFVYLRVFDFVDRPGGLIYIGACLAVGVPLPITLMRFGADFGRLTHPAEVIELDAPVSGFASAPLDGRPVSAGHPPAGPALDDGEDGQDGFARRSRDDR